jgi:Phage integrase family
MAARALRFTILTVARSGETLGMTWDEVDFDAATWVVPASRMKMGKEHTVPLSDAAVAILRAQEAERDKNSHIFAGRPQRPLSGMAMSVLLRRMKVPATVHGMRSSARSWMADNGVEFELAEACLAHQVGNAVVQAYQRSSARAGGGHDPHRDHRRRLLPRQSGLRCRRTCLGSRSIIGDIRIEADVLGHLVGHGESYSDRGKPRRAVDLRPFIFLRQKIRVHPSNRMVEGGRAPTCDRGN